MAEKQKNSPKGSEKKIDAWLDQIGATTKKYVGGNGSGGPPDFVIQYDGDTIAVEATLLCDPQGWGMKKEIAFEKLLRRLIHAVSAEGEDMPRWHATCEYDHRVSRPPKSGNVELKRRVRDALRSCAGGEFQLLPDEHVRGRGIVLELVPASNRGGLSGVSVDEGAIVAETLSDRLVAIVKKKAGTVRKGPRSGKYTQWWLVVDDAVLRAPIRTLTLQERDEIDTRVQESDGISTWSKVVMVGGSRTGPDRTLAYLFYAPWEDARYPLLPKSPC